ncbi:hydrogenase maturation nickel metallochaperone HypA [bacterium]|nr:hydrogenase maturation nickel metallochaperone HypA [bacterium]MBU1071609.1 hydrogenase maturation nickel metallochaperone HypA [bacterium]MBU1674466.1 hydrogenase maturation nickel metallochaperone HypA [bacterium]
MHEMSLAMNIVAIAGEQAAAHGAGAVRAIHADVGVLAGVEARSLAFCFEAARAGTPMADAELVIHEIPGRGRCRDCGAEVPVAFFVAVCPECGAGGVEITSGRELRVRSLDIA